MVCRQCGHFSEKKLRGLSGLCPGVLPYKSEQTEAEKKRALYRYRLLRGLHPLTKAGLPPVRREGDDPTA